METIGFLVIIAGIVIFVYLLIFTCKIAYKCGKSMQQLESTLSSIAESLKKTTERLEKNFVNK